MKEFVLIIDEHRVSCYENVEENYQITRIKGEVFFEFSDFQITINFLAEYIKNLIGISSFDEIKMIIYLHKDYFSYGQSILQSFNATKIMFMNFELIKEYNQQLNDVNGPLVADLKSKNQLLEMDLSLLKNNNYELNTKVDELLTAIKAKDIENIELKNKVDFIYKYLNEITEVKREIVFKTNEYDTWYNPMSWNQINVDGICIVDGTYILKGQKIYDDSKQSINSPMEGYIFWFKNEMNFYDNNGKKAFAIITNQKEDTMKIILNDIKKNPEKYKISEVRNGNKY